MAKKRGIVYKTQEISAMCQGSCLDVSNEREEKLMMMLSILVGGGELWHTGETAVRGRWKVQSVGRFSLLN